MTALAWLGVSGVLLAGLFLAGYTALRLARTWQGDRLDAAAAKDRATRDRERTRAVEDAAIDNFRRSWDERMERAKRETDAAAAAVAARRGWDQLRGGPDR